MFAITMGPHYNSKNLQSKFSHNFLELLDFFYKTEFFSMILPYIWVEYELMNKNVLPIT